MLYTVDEVSERLGVPRPTLYRYLKEYAVPYERHAGRISIPEQSLERIRRVRELHDEGLGTAAVRKRLDEREASEIERISERLDRLSEEIERSRVTDNTSMPSSQALNVVLARQTVLISAVYDLTRMVEQLLEREGRPRSPLAYGENGSRDEVPLSPTAARPSRRRPAAPAQDLASDRFGTLARRRRLTVVGIALLVVVVCLAWAAGTFGANPF
jgi:excisionase family DNA binding protein